VLCYPSSYFVFFCQICFVMKLNMFGSVYGGLTLNSSDFYPFLKNSMSYQQTVFVCLVIVVFL
jgi:hypothetical protein